MHWTAYLWGHRVLENLAAEVRHAAVVLAGLRDGHAALPLGEEVVEGEREGDGRTEGLDRHDDLGVGAGLDANEQVCIGAEVGRDRGALAVLRRGVGLTAWVMNRASIVHQGEVQQRTQALTFQVWNSSVSSSGVTRRQFLAR